MAQKNISSLVGETSLSRSYLSSSTSIESIYSPRHRPVSLIMYKHILQQEEEHSSAVCRVKRTNKPLYSVFCDTTVLNHFVFVRLSLLFSCFLIFICTDKYIIVSHVCFLPLHRLQWQLLVFGFVFSVFFLFLFFLSLLFFLSPSFLSEQNHKDRMFQVFTFLPH